MLMRHIRSVTLRSLGSDMTMTRWTIALASLACGLLLIGPEQYFDREGYRLMRGFIEAVAFGGRFMSAEDFYGYLFLLHFTLAIWRIYDPVERARWSLWVNVYGFVLIFTLGVSIDLSLKHPTLLSGVAFALSWMAFWNIVRTANGAQEVGP